MKIYCYSEDAFEGLFTFIQHLHRQNFRIVSLREALKNENIEQNNICSVVVRSDKEELLSRVCDYCLETGETIAVFLTQMVSDACFAKLHQCSHTPLFCDLSLLHRYSATYLRNRTHLQVVFADRRIDQDTRALLYENRVRLILSYSSVDVKGIQCHTVENAFYVPAKGDTPLKEHFIEKPLLNRYPFAPFGAILGNAVFACKWKRSYMSANGVYSFVCNECGKHIEMQRNGDVSAESLISVLENGFYPLVYVSAQQAPYLLTSRDPASRTFVAYRWRATGLHHRESLPYRLLSDVAYCACLKSKEDEPSNPIPFFKDTCLAELPVANAYLQDLYRRETFDQQALASLAAFLEERVILWELIYRDTTEKGLYLPIAEEHLLLIERHVRPVLCTVEQRRDLMSVHNRLLMADGLTKVLLSEERFIEGYLEELDRYKRDAEWVELLRKKGEKR